MSDDPVSQDGLRSEMRRSLVERLRIPWDAMGDMANQQRAEAAVQISTMLDEIKELRGMLEVANEMAEYYANERDQARVDVCIFWDAIVTRRVTLPFPPTKECFSYAQSRGWDCFKEKP